MLPCDTEIRLKMSIIPSPYTSIWFQCEEIQIWGDEIEEDRQDLGATKLIITIIKVMTQTKN